MKYKYPSKNEIEKDVNNETTAINVAISSMSDSLQDCPLKKNLLVYAAIELAFKYGDAEYVEEVFSEILLLKGEK